MKDEFFAVTKNEKFLRADSFQSLLNNIDSDYEIIMYGAFFYDKPYITQNNKEYYWPQIKILDINNQPTTFQKGAFKVKRIHPDQGSYYHKGRLIEFENCLTGEIVQKPTPYVEQGKDFVTVSDFYYELMDLFDKLNEEVSETLYGNN